MLPVGKNAGDLILGQAFLCDLISLIHVDVSLVSQVCVLYYCFLL